MANTERRNLPKTERRFGNDAASSSSNLVILSPVIFEDDGKEYEISNELIGQGGESQVYKATEIKTGRACAAKLDTSGLTYQAVARENRKRVVEFLRNHTDFHKYHIMPLLASGTIQIQGQESDGYAADYPVDIFPECPNGNMDRSGQKITYEQLKNRVIPALISAMNTIHTNKLIHRDIKPANIFELDGEIILGDFGTTIFDEETDDGSAYYTRTARATPGYNAPEINLGYVTKAVDYFSFGCTLATLYNGRHPYAALLDNPATAISFSKDIMDGKSIFAVSQKGGEVLKHLVDALVRKEPSMRIGYEGVSLWLKDINAFVRKYGSAPDTQSSLINAKTRPDAGSQTVKWKEPFNFEDVKYWNEKDLAAAMVSKWAAAKRYLYRGQIMPFFKGDQTLQNRIDRIVNEAPTAKNDDLGLARFIHYLLKGGSLYWCGHEYKTLSDIAERIAGGIGKTTTAEHEIVHMLQSEYLSWKHAADMERPGIDPDVKKALKNNLEGILSIEKMAKKHPQLAYYYSMFQWSKNIEPSIAGADAFFEELTGKSDKVFYCNIEALPHDDFAWASIAHFGFENDVVELKNRLGNNARDNITLIFDVFEKICENKALVRRKYFMVGPDAYLYWLKGNLSLYTFNSGDAKSLKTKIEEVRFSDKMSLSDLKESFRKLNGYFSAGGDFQKLFQNDFLIACLGLTKGKARHGEITAINADAFFLDTFFGNAVPAGFRKHLGLSDSVCRSNTVRLGKSSSQPRYIIGIMRPGKPVSAALKENAAPVTAQTAKTSSVPIRAGVPAKSQNQIYTREENIAYFMDAGFNALAEENRRRKEKISMNDIMRMDEKALNELRLRVANNMAGALTANGAGTVITPQSEKPSNIARDAATELRGEYGERVPSKTIGMVRRNDPCPCGSGKKYKYCCGQGV